MKNKCIVRLYILSGGAPKSIYEYLKILKEKKYEINVITEFDEDAILYKYQSAFDNVIEWYDIGHLVDEHKYICALKETKREYQLIKEMNPSIIIVQGGINGYFYSYMCEKMGIPLIIIIAGGDIKSQLYLAKGWNYGQLICFSKENKEAIQPFCDDTSIHVITNRISQKKRFYDIEKHYIIEDGINILIVSRIDEDKIQSIFSFLARIEKAKTTKAFINIRIAGKGGKEKELCERLCIINGEKTNIKIQYLGHIDNLESQFEWAHIVVGKGRSVIEPIMMNRIGCIIGDNGESCVCTERSFSNLLHYNFAGRNIKYTEDENDFTKVIQELIYGTYDIMQILKVGEMIEKAYSSDFLSAKFLEIIESMPVSKKKEKRVHIYKIFLSFMMRKIINKMVYSHE